MWKYNFVAFCWAAFVCNQCVGALKSTSNSNLLSEYTITPSRQLAYYNYPTPNRGFQLPAAVPAHHIQRQHTQSPRYASNGYQVNYATATAGQLSSTKTIATTATTAKSFKSTISKQFSSPALEQAAFTMALTSHGYRFGAIPSQPVASSSPPQTQTQSRSSPQSPTTSPAVISSPDAYSLNVKLPLPLGSAPIKLGPLPLQAGAPYASIPRGLTSYGTPHPLRR